MKKQKMLDMFHIGIIDIAILVIVTLFAIGGFRQGFFKEVLGMIALGGGYYFFVVQKGAIGGFSLLTLQQWWAAFKKRSKNKDDDNNKKN